MTRKIYYAHSANEQGDWQTMCDHATNVAEDAKLFASFFGAGEEAELCGWLHDVGKYSDLFDRRLHNEEKGLDHWSVGAWIAGTKYKSLAALLAIQGHHTGMLRGDVSAIRDLEPKKLNANHPLQLRMTETDTQLLLARLMEDGFQPQIPADKIMPNLAETAAQMLDVRMLFSALVDADFMDTAEHFDEPRQAGVELRAGEALQHLTRHMEKIREEAKADPVVLKMRDDLYSACYDAGVGDIGLWTLTAPTGAGKTLAMLAFALRHAAEKRLRRIVIVLPYLTIIEQTAKEYRRIFEPIFGKGYVLEHHSMAQWRKEGQKKNGNADAEEAANRYERQLAENWDAPIVITTSVQMLESLHSNRPFATRKCHRLAQSCILFDEVQTLPQHLTLPTLKTLSRLASKKYGTSVVFATATQPAFGHLHDKVLEDKGEGWKPREIVPETLNLFSRTKRVNVDWSRALTPIAWDILADEIAQDEQPQSLCIVNMRADAQNLASMLIKKCEGVRHLSTWMCPAHRKRVLAEVKTDIANKKPCRVISTQLLEAGVDLDMPLLGYRAFCMLPSIAQAAGRVNRNGNKRSGRLVVFLPENAKYPDKTYEQATKVTEDLLKKHFGEGLNIYDPTVFEEYYHSLYSLAALTKPEIEKAISLQDYKTLSEEYRLIKNDAIQVLVPYHEDGKLTRYDELRDKALKHGLSAKWMRQASDYTINVWRPKPEDAFWDNLRRIPLKKGGESEDWFIYENAHEYNDLLGLMPGSQTDCQA